MALALPQSDACAPELSRNRKVTKDWSQGRSLLDQRIEAAKRPAFCTGPPTVVDALPVEDSPLLWKPKKLACEHQNEDGVPCVALLISLSGGTCVIHG